DQLFERHHVDPTEIHPSQILAQLPRVVADVRVVWIRPDRRQHWPALAPPSDSVPVVTDRGLERVAHDVYEAGLRIELQDPLSNAAELWRPAVDGAGLTDHRGALRPIEQADVAILAAPVGALPHRGPCPAQHLWIDEMTGFFRRAHEDRGMRSEELREKGRARLHRADQKQIGPRAVHRPVGGAPELAVAAKLRREARARSGCSLVTIAPG